MKIPALPSIPSFTSDSVTKYFKFWELLKYERANPTTIYTRSNVTSEETMIDNEENENALKTLTSLLQLGQDERELVLSEKRSVEELFEDVIDQRAFWNNDHVRMRALLQDWYTAQKTLVTKSRRASDPYSLSSDELDDLILSFGFPYPYKLEKNDKAAFLHSLIEYYQHKGSPAALGSVLTFFGLTDFVLSEWWLKKDPGIQNLSMHSEPIWPSNVIGSAEHKKVIPYLPFVMPDPYWHYDKEEGPNAESVLSKYNETTTDSTGGTVPANLITLPSITPYISLNMNIYHEKVQYQTSILNRTIQESFEWWVQYCLVKPEDTTNFHIIGVPLPTTYIDGTTTLQYGDVVRWTRDIVHDDCTDGTGGQITHGTKTTDNVWNGEEWVDLNCTLPNALLNFNPEDYGGRERYNPSRTWEVNIEPENSYSLLEIFLAAHFLHNHQLINGLKRYPAVPDDTTNMDDGEFYDATNEIVVLEYERQLTRGYADIAGGGIFDPVLAENSTTEEAKRPSISLIVRVLETESDHIYSTKHNDWFDLKNYLEYKDETGNMSAVVWIPPNPSENVWDQSSLFYSGSYSPLDLIWQDTTGVAAGLRDDIDDTTILYGEIGEEWDDISERPKDIIYTNAQVGPNPNPALYPTWDGYEQHPILSMWQQRQDQIEERRDAFYRGEDTTDYTAYAAPYYLEPGRFLHAMAPNLYNAIVLEAYILGITYTYSETPLHRKKEVLWSDLGWILNELGLDALKSISYYMVGLAYWETIKKVVNFFKPYRARFLELLVDYIIDDPVGDGVYAEDNCFPSCHQYANDPTYTDESLITSPVLWFEDKHYGKIFEGQLREFDEFVRCDVSIRLDESVYVYESLMGSFHLLLVNTDGPYNYDACRIEDSLYVQVGEVLMNNELDVEEFSIGEDSTGNIDAILSLTGNIATDGTDYLLVSFDTGESQFLALFTEVLQISPTVEGLEPYTGWYKFEFKVGDYLPSACVVVVFAIHDGDTTLNDIRYVDIQTEHNVELFEYVEDLIGFLVVINHTVDTDISGVKLVIYDSDV